ncbi:sodium- and chloride-dependent betaine transporter-like [Phyllopteryx taeniolatus]|uniref:sodium- and chloride-dependent betaine transporter-like n=1 Tax=Phyllopteryx taeniolatus TaxID=161469 RepID=UPI002AD269D4|nr:sodium- and chloride-dependent betaine transporter-like [Phyllopteryx taeniolatus]
MTEETTGGSPTRQSDPNKVDANEGGPIRGKWANKWEFLLSMTGEIIGLGNVWRFPYLCYKNGGGVFLIPYFLFLAFGGIPIFFLETALGQYTSQGTVTAWRAICPMFQGVGVASLIIVIYLNIYYIVVLAWVLFYLFNSFQNPLPWSTCENWWNTDNCYDRESPYANPHLFQPDGNWSFLNNISTYDYFENFTDTSLNGSFLMVKSAEEEFWTNRVLRMSESMSLGKVHWDLALCLLLAWVVCYFCIWKGIKSTGKVVYFTATFPYLMLIILFLRGVSLPGAGEGLKFYLLPDFGQLGRPDVWFDAGTQVFFTYAICQGVLTSLGSYNKYNNNCYRDCVALCLLNSATSIFAGFVVFSVLGFMAFHLDVAVEDVVTSGPGLAFIAYPKALSMLPGAPFWTVLFFLMMLLLGLDTQFVCVESLATAISDLFPRHLRRPCAREILVLLIAVVCFLLGLPLVTEGGILLFHLIDNFGPSGTSLLIIACFQSIVIGWVYGADRFLDNIEDMIGYRPFPVLKYCWLLVTPLLCVVTMLYDLAKTQSLMVYDYQMGTWGLAVGSLLILTPLICIPAFILITLCRSPQNMTTPSSELRQARPHNPTLTLCAHVVRGPARARTARGGDEKMAMGEASGV